MRKISKREVESMPRKPHQRARLHGQPYTRVERVTLPRVEPTPTGEVKTFQVYKYQATGYTFEAKFGEDEEWHTIVEEHDLGKADTLEIAHVVARDWRADLVGVYPIS